MTRQTGAVPEQQLAGEDHGVDPCLKPLTDALTTHVNGLNHLNITNEDGYCAVFIVNTPALDDSGVGHAVEHLVFRRSKAFNDPSSLFQLSSLTDLTINASTMSQVTYFHCQSMSLATFELGLCYLLNGLFSPEFDATDLTRELHDGVNCGVIFRELSGLLADPVARRQYQADKGDVSGNSGYQFGGDPNAISQLTVEDLINYHAQYYRPCEITLVTANASNARIAALIEDLISPAANDLADCSLSYRPKPRSIATQFEQGRQLVRWWLKPAFFNYVERHYLELVTLISSLNAQLLPPKLRVNPDGLFSLDVIVSESDTGDFPLANLTQRFNQFVASNPVPERINASDTKRDHNQKYSPAINRLLDVYYAINASSIAAGALNFGLPSLHRLATISDLADSEVIGQQTSLDPVSNVLIAPIAGLSEAIAKRNSGTQHRFPAKSAKPLPKLALPGLLTPVYSQAITKLNGNFRQGPSDPGVALASDLAHCIFVAQIAGPDIALASLASFIIGAYPPFLAPRTQGHCYLISARFLEETEQLIVFSALDVTPTLRLSAISHYLLLLSQDVRFIDQSLTLAKEKLSDYYHYDMRKLSAISSEILTEFLYELSDTLIRQIKLSGTA